MMLTSLQARYLVLGLLLRLVLLLFGLYQDASSPTLPYTDVDYSVFLDGARSLVHGCPLSAAVPAESEPMESLLEFQQPLGTAVDACAQGWLSIGARYILQHESILVARSRGPEEAEQARKKLGDDASLSLIEPSKIETILLPVSLTVMRPILRPLASMGNPYARSTYRYTPLLAVILAPGAWMGGWVEKLWGKIVFSLADVAVALLMWDILRTRRTLKSQVKKEFPGGSSWPRSPLAALQWLKSSLRDPTHAVGLLHLLNPFPAQIATRGSSESILGLLILGFLSASVRLIASQSSVDDRSPQAIAASQSSSEPAQSPIQQHADELAADDGSSTAQVASSSTTSTPGTIDDTLSRYLPLPALSPHVLLAPTLLALAAHWKLFPAIFGVAILAALLSGEQARPQHSSNDEKSNESPPPPAQPRYLDALGFAATSSYAFLGLAIFVWAIWGHPYLQESLFYHATRLDHRHNFSPYFFPLYLLYTPSTGVASTPSLLSSLASFLPQFLVILGVGWRVGRKGDVVMAIAAQTMAFVTFNKVVTSQYFTWYLPLLPILLPSMSFASTLPLLVWIASQALWLSQAYLLELKGQDVWLRVWLAGVLWLGSNAWILSQVLQAWHQGREEIDKQDKKQTKVEKAQ